ncbi:MAG: magnesium transporter CorA family protein [Anaerolineae bacterium]
MQVTVFTAAGAQEKSVADLPSLLHGEHPAACVWVDMTWANMAHPDPEDLRTLEQVFKFHPLAIEDTRNHRQRPKIEEYADYFFLIMNAVSYRNGDLVFRELDVFFGRNYLVTVRYTNEPVIDTMRQRISTRLDTNKENMCSMLMYHLALAVVDSYFPIIDKVALDIDRLEETITANPQRVKLDQLFALKRDLTEMWRIASQQRDMFNVMMHRDLFAPNHTMQYYFRDVYDHLLLINDLINMHRDMAASLLDFHLSVSSNRLNLVVNRLAVITIVTSVFTVISGFYGMNFLENILDFSDPLGALKALIMMVAAAVGVLVLLKKRGFF